MSVITLICQFQYLILFMDNKTDDKRFLSSIMHKESGVVLASQANMHCEMAQKGMKI